MCGRFTLTNTEAVKEKIGFDIKASFNVKPLQSILILKPKPMMTPWGLSPNWAKKPLNLINARIETLNEKPAFANTLPCLVVTDGWYEWKKSDTSGKQPFYFHNQGKILYMAGIFNEIGCAIITKEASSEIANIHRRQPILLNKSGRRIWMKESNIYPEHYHNQISCHRVGSFVNSQKFDDPICVEPISESPH